MRWEEVTGHRMLFLNVVYEKGSQKQNISKYYFGREGGGHK